MVEDVKPGIAAAFNARWHLYPSQVIAAVLYEMNEQVSLTTDDLRQFSPKQLTNLVAGHLHKYGMSLVSKQLPDSMLIRRQDVVSSLKGLV